MCISEIWRYDGYYMIIKDSISGVLIAENKVRRNECGDMKRFS
jgi:hypothetical protein